MPGRVAPGLFSANGDGLGVAVATAVRVARDGTPTPLEVSRYDPEQKRHFAAPLNIRADYCSNAQIRSATRSDTTSRSTGSAGR
ncbi:MAG: hypothetical protein OXJ37_22875 [Bryobacterales bacterium]|nr:hypothetical protein [Bryobacterales bacterium]MDE0623224.1 hypothetical protein [Bryobacterales bacterium]